MPRSQPEHNAQKALIVWAKYNEFKYPDLWGLHAVPNGGHRIPAVAAKLKKEGTKPGVFDLALDVARHGYHGLKIEMKIGKNKLTADQSKWKAWYERQGYKTAVCYGWHEAAEELEEYLR